MEVSGTGRQVPPVILAGRQKALPRSATVGAAGATAVASVIWSGRRSVEELWTYAEPGPIPQSRDPKWVYVIQKDLQRKTDTSRYFD